MSAFDGYTSTAEDRGGLTLDKYLEVARRFREMPPVVTRLYFVDRLAEYYKLSLVSESEKASSTSLFVPTSIFGSYQVYVMRSRDWTDILPECCKLSGIWAVMSDGSYRRLDMPEVKL